MGEQAEEKKNQKPTKHICAGLLAHVDAGKTTLSEALLYRSGSIRTLGRVDHQDAFLDTDAMERARGITIFSKQAVFSLGEMVVTLLDTPGHVDFSAEMERTLQVLDYGILVISGADGVQGHTLTLWKLLARYHIPVFLFINKMDQEGTDRKKLLEELQDKLDGQCVDFTGPKQEFLENIAMCDEGILERYLESGQVETEEIQELIAGRKLFPCYFGSALKLDGVDEFLTGLSVYARSPSYSNVFGAKVFKIARDAQGNRLTYMKITGGKIKVKDTLTGCVKGQAEEVWEEKVNQLRIYSGSKFERVAEAEAGMVCAATGLTKTYAGQGLGDQLASDMPVLEPVLSYQIILPEGCDPHVMLGKLRQLEEEEPLLHIMWNEEINKIHAQLMGEVQIDVVKNLIQERFGITVEFGAGHIVYKETILEPEEGAGHFEPLRHYAEVRLLLEPGERGSGMQFAARCSEDVLDRNWQRLVLTHLEEREHRGVLTGAPITDIKITVTGGRAHLKHTEGGDFRQATYRAVRQGLMKAKSILLEPYYDFRLEIPAEVAGRAMADIQKMSGTFEGPQIEEGTAILTGSVPAIEMGAYQLQVAAYSKGAGRLFCTMKGYEPCHNEEEVLAASLYDPELDFEHTPDSVFCSHGAGFVVPWYQVEAYMHTESVLDADDRQKDGEFQTGCRQDDGDFHTGSGQDDGLSAIRYSDGISDSGKRPGRYGGKSAAGNSSYGGSLADDKELEEIFKRTYGESKRQRFQSEQRAFGGALSGKRVLKERNWEKKEPVEEYLLVDGYNVIFSWEELKELAKTSLDGARQRLMEILSNYQGFKSCHVVLVFDAYKVQGHAGEVQKYFNIHVAYTKESETADQFIEKAVHELGKKYHVTVATSDGLEQVIILGQGGLRMSALELKEEVERTNQVIREEYLDRPRKKQNLLFQDLNEETAAYIKEVSREEQEKEQSRKRGEQEKKQSRKRAEQAKRREKAK